MSTSPIKTLYGNPVQLVAQPIRKGDAKALRSKLQEEDEKVYMIPSRKTTGTRWKVYKLLN